MALSYRAPVRRNSAHFVRQTSEPVWFQIEGPVLGVPYNSGPGRGWRAVLV